MGNIPYRLHFACFVCRRAIKSRNDAPLCVTCGKEMAKMGRKFHTPAKRDIEQWQKIHLLYERGWRVWGWNVNPKMSLRQTQVYLLEKPVLEKAARRASEVEQRARALRIQRKKNIRMRLSKCKKG